jgi:hypothetical protein
MVNDYDVFLSYARTDAREAADAIVQRLTSNGWRVWSDQSLAVGQDMAGAVEDAMARARVIVILLSAAAADSRWVHRELAYALRRQTSVIPVVLDRSALDSPLGSLLGDRVYVDVSGMRPMEMADNVLTALNKHGFVPASPPLAAPSGRRRPLYSSVIAALIVVGVLTATTFWQLGIRQVEVAQSNQPERLVEQIRQGVAGKDLRGVNLARAGVAGAKLESADLSTAVLSAADLSGAAISLAKFDAATMAEVRLGGATARSASFVSATLLAADLKLGDFSNSNFTNADLRLADLRGAIFLGSELEGIRLEGAVYDKSTQWPTNFDPQNRGAKCADCVTPK